MLFRMALDDRISHIPFIQTGAAIIIRNEIGEILLQERTDRNKWGLPGGCQELGEDLRVTAVREAYEETGIKLNPLDIELIDRKQTAKYVREKIHEEFIKFEQYKKTEFKK